MFEVFVYIIVTVVVLAFCGQSKRYAVLDIPDPTRIAELELLDQLLAACNEPAPDPEIEAAIAIAEQIVEALEPTRYEASEMPSDVCLVVPTSEWLAPLRQAKRHDLGCMTAAELRELCREHHIPVNSRGRISQAVLDQLADVI